MEQVENVNTIPQDDNAGDYVGIEDLMSESEESTVEQAQTAPAPDDAGTAAPAPEAQTAQTQTDFDKVLGKRLYDERSKQEARWRSTPQYLLGEELLKERMAKDNLSEADAYERIRAERRDAKAQQYARNPQEFYNDYLAEKEQPRQTQQSGGAEEFTRALIEAGAPDMGFTADDITASFTEDVQKYGVQAALAMWQRTREAGTRAQAREQMNVQRSLPRPHTVQGQPAGAPAYDYSTMSDEDFDKVIAKLNQATLDGRRVKL